MRVPGTWMPVKPIPGYFDLKDFRYRGDLQKRLQALMDPSASDKPDILGRPDLVKLVDSFYTKVRADESLGHVFDGVAKVDWSTHLPKLYDFWDTVLFRAGTFRGDPIGAHAKLLAQTDMSWPLFERWLELFRETVNEHFAGENAGHIIRCAEDMARVVHSKIHAIPNPRFDPAQLTLEQQARYATYRDS